MLKDIDIENAVTAQVVSAPKYNSLSSADCWVLMLNLACALAPQGSDDFNFKDGSLPPLISNLPARNMREAEMAVYLIEMGVPLKKVSRYIEQLMFLQVHSFAPHDRIDALIALHPVTSTGPNSHNVLLISPPSAFSASA